MPTPRTVLSLLSVVMMPVAAPAGAVESGLGSEYETFDLVQVADGLEHPWAVALLGDGDYLVSERGGTLYRLADGEREAVSGVPEVHTENQGGLLDVVLHPEFDANRKVYLTFSRGDEDGTATALARGVLDGHALEDVEILFEQDRRSEPGRHYGSRIAWKDDGTLLMSIGDRGVEPERAQDPGDHAGAVVRLDPDGSVPADNPFVDDEDTLPEIYSLGHRNIQGMVVDRRSGAVWATEHGPRGGDELNRIDPGANYGWPAATRGRDYSTQDQFPGSSRDYGDTMHAPFYEILPSHSPSGLAMVTGDRFEAWRGDLLAGGLRGERIRRLVIEGEEVVHDEELLHGVVGRIRDVREADDGRIYVLTDEREGGLYRIE